MRGSEKISKILNYKQISPSKLANILGLKNVQNIYDIQKDRCNISTKMRKKKYMMLFLKSVRNGY
jgi:predicted Zn-ribbon and HTH transcriptional regulator